MKPLYSAASVREWDHSLINDRGVPSHTLMEIAGRECAKRIHDRFPPSSVSVFCGSGNNGGDGYVIARWLHLWGWKVSIVAVAAPKSSESQLNEKLLPQNVHKSPAPVAADVMVDCMLGTGQQSEPLGRYKEMIDWINTQDAIVISVDVPSGRCPDEGHPFGESFLSPSICLSIGGLKSGLYGQHYGQIIEEIDIGLDLIEPPKPIAFLMERADVLRKFPIHPHHFSKWDKGHVAIFAKGGAAVLAAHAALLAGAGLVTILFDKGEQPSLHGLRPEVMCTPLEQLNPRRHNTLVIGPNIGFSKASVAAVCDLWRNFPNPVVVDADAIQILSAQGISKSSFLRVLTPHHYEAAALLRLKPEEIQRRPYKSIQLLQEHGLAMLKAPYTKLGDRVTFVNPIASNRLGIAGSGDILSGILGGLLAQRVAPVDSMILSGFLHSSAGQHMERGDSASDLLTALKTVFTKFEKLILS